MSLLKFTLTTSIGTNNNVLVNSETITHVQNAKSVGNEIFFVSGNSIKVKETMREIYDAIEGRVSTNPTNDHF